MTAVTYQELFVLLTRRLCEGHYLALDPNTPQGIGGLGMRGALLRTVSRPPCLLNPPSIASVGEREFSRTVVEGVPIARDDVEESYVPLPSLS